MAEASGENGVLLVREGMFWRTYEHGALALCECVHPFKVTTRYYKGIDQWLSYVGFPDKSLDKWAEGRELTKVSEQMVCLRLTAEEHKHIADTFGDWKSQQVTLAKANSAKRTETQDHCGETKAIASVLSSERQVVLRLRSFPLESSSPLDCMNFIAELKNILRTNNDTTDSPRRCDTEAAIAAEAEAVL